MRVTTWWRSPGAVALYLAALMGLAGTLSLASEIGRTFGGYLSYSVALEDIGYVSTETPSWWPIYQFDGVSASTLLSVNGLPYTPNAQAEFEKSAPGDIVVLGLTHDGSELAGTIDVPVLRFSWAHFLDLKLPEFIIALSFWLLGLVVLRAGPREPTNQVFAILAAIVATHRMLNTNVIFTDNRLLPNLLEAAILIDASFIGAIAFHFSWLYPTSLPNRPRRLIVLFYIVSAAIAVLLAAGRVTWWGPIVSPPNVTLTAIAYQIMLVLYLVGVLSIVFRLIYSGVSHRNSRRQKRILILTGIGLATAAPFLILSAADIIPGLDPELLYWHHLDLRFLFIAIPLALALAIVRYQNLAAPSRVFVFVAVVGISALLANITSWLWITTLPEDLAHITRPPFVPFFLPIFAASLFWSMQATWSGLFGRFWHRETMTNAATRDIGRRIPPAADREELAQILVDAVAGELELEGSAVWLAEEQTGRFILTAQAGYQGEQLPQELPFPSYPVSNQPIRLKGSAPTPHWLAPLENHLSLEVVMPLYHEAEPVALLGYGRRWDEDIFDERDLVVIELIGQQALLYLQVSRQIEELRQMPHLVSAAQERERTLLAAELHDTIQQFLGRLPFFLVASKEAMLDDPEEAGALLERSLGDIEEAAIAVQRIRQNLAPNQLERSLTRSLSALAAHDNQRYGLKVALDIAGDIDEATDLEARHALYRVIQHALDNVAAHAGTQDVAIRLAREDGRVTFAVVDDGNGASTEDLWQAQSLGHFGLQSMQARMEACGGELSLKTAPGLGMEVSGWAPAADSSDSA